MAFILVSLCSLENALRFDTKKSKFLFAALAGFPKTTHINFIRVYSSVLELQIEPAKLQEELRESNRAPKFALPCQYICWLVVLYPELDTGYR